MKDFNSIEYKRSRKAYTAQCAIEYFVELLVADAFLAKVLTFIGISDALVGIISSFITFAFFFQLLSIYLVRTRISTKKLVITIDTASIFFFMLLYLVPFLPLGHTAKTILAVLSVFLAYAAKYTVLSIYYKWGNSFVVPQKRASFSATKEVISLILGMGVTAAAGRIIDKYESIGKLSGGLLFIAVSIFLLNVLNFICLAMIKKEDKEERAKERVPKGTVFKNTLGNRNFRNVVVLTAIWEAGRYFSIGFMGVFKTKDLLMSVFLIQIINIIAAFLRAAVSRAFGKYSDRTSYAKGMKIGLIIAAAAFFVNIFTNPSHWYIIIAHTILYNCALAATNQNSFNITYSYVKTEYVTSAMAIKNSIGGICGFLASLVAGKIVALIQASNNQMFGVTVYAQQILSAVSFVFVAVAIVYITKIIEKQKIIAR